jgi:hypothetical protein
MKTALKILLIPIAVSGLAAFGMWATVLAERPPSPIAKIGVPPATPLGFNPDVVSKRGADVHRGRPPMHLKAGGMGSLGEEQLA